jgi:RNA-directed DNA polymerase
MPPTGPKVNHRNLEALKRPPTTEVGKPRRPAVDTSGSGASPVVGARESRVQGEGRQGVGTHRLPEERSVDSDQQADKAWLLSVQRKLYQWSRDNPDEAYRDLWNWVTDPRNLRCAWRRVSSNKGKRTPGIDGVTVAQIRSKQGWDAFVRELRQQLRTRRYQPSPSRRKLIPKSGKPGKFRPLGIPTVCDRVVQSAVKQILEPIFEAQFWHVSYGFRPGRSSHGALEHIRVATTPRAKDAHGKRRRQPYPWVIEGDIRACFDEIGHHALLTRLRRRVADRKVTRLVGKFLKAGVMAEEQFIRTSAGTPQGGILSPLLANIALSAIEQRYERWVHKTPAKRKNAQTDLRKAAYIARKSDRRSGRLVCLPIRYADDFVVLVSGSGEQAETEKDALAEHLRFTLGLELSAEKTRITPMRKGFDFLGHRVRLKWGRQRGFHTSLEIPKEKTQALRHRIKRLTGRSTTNQSLASLLRRLNPVIRGWANFYRHCFGAHAVFSRLDWYIWDRIWRWLRKKHPNIGARKLYARYCCRTSNGRRKVWCEDDVEIFFAGTLTVERFRLANMSPPDFTRTPGEPDA